jgi:hypothetical protein
MERQGLPAVPDSRLPGGNHAFPPRWVDVKQRVPSDALDAPALIQRLKHAKKNVEYADFVIARNGDPEIGEQEFRRLLERLPPAPHMRKERVPFQPSWIDTEGRYYQLLWEKGNSLRLLRDDGILGECSRTDFQTLFRPLPPETGSFPDEAGGSEQDLLKK